MNGDSPIAGCFLNVKSMAILLMDDLGVLYPILGSLHIYRITDYTGLSTSIVIHIYC